VVQIVDNPGYFESEEADAEHMKTTIELHKNLRYVSLFVLVLNGSEPRYDSKVKKTVEHFHVNFGDLFWDNICIVFTHWSNFPREVRIRAMQMPPVTEELRKKEILENLNRDFPVTQGK
jgi:hypothetical protein